jgi:hypothetical protein
LHIYLYNKYDVSSAFPVCSWLGNLKKEVSRFGSGAALRHSYDGSGGAKRDGGREADLLLHNNYGGGNRDAKMMTDFLSHTKSVFSRPAKDYTAGDENALSQPRSALLSGSGGGLYPPSKPPRGAGGAGAGLRRSIDNAEMLRPGGSDSGSVYRL